MNGTIYVPAVFLLDLVLTLSYLNIFVKFYNTIYPF